MGLGCWGLAVGPTATLRLGAWGAWPTATLRLGAWGAWPTVALRLGAGPTATACAGRVCCEGRRQAAAVRSAAA